MDIDMNSIEFNINDYLKKMLEFDDHELALNDFLAGLGKKWDCDRSYIFEKISPDRFSNTYEWCADGVEAQMSLLQNEPIELIDWWWELFEGRELVIISDVEDIKLDRPQVYATLKPQNIQTLVACGIYINGKLEGFLGLDNPRTDKLEEISSFLMEESFLLTISFERRDTFKKVKHYESHDQLTGLKNRLAYQNYLDNIGYLEKIGVVHCDILSLKETNKKYGFSRGDEEIIYWAGVLTSTFGESNIYRVAGDQFIIILEDLNFDKFKNLLDRLRLIVGKSEATLLFGAAWQEEDEEDKVIIEKVIEFAKHITAMKKRDHYKELGMTEDVDEPYGDPKDFVLMGDISELKKYLKENYFDLFSVINSLSISDFYVFMGDLKTNNFYISDEMKLMFGFESNIIHDFFGEWEKRIVEESDLNDFRNDVENVRKNNLGTHDMRYKVRDRFNNEIWIHTHGQVKISEENGEAIFISGVATSQENSFIVDPISNLPKENPAIVRILEAKETSPNLTIIGFKLNNFKEINELRGRKETNEFLYNMIKSIVGHYGDRLDFFRLDGLRFIGIINDSFENNYEEYINGIRKIIEESYNSYGLSIKTPCSLAILREESDKAHPQETLANIINLLTRAKLEPSKPYLVFSNESLVYQKKQTRMSMELNNDVLNDFKNFRVVVQPVVDSKTLKIISGEILLRWTYEGKDVSPGVFIPILEKNGMIVSTGMWVLEAACKHILRIFSYSKDIALSVNISYYQILDPYFFGFVKETLEKYDVRGENLIFEITETHYDESPMKVREFIDGCRSLGIRVAIDDFGDGYSSLAFLLKHTSDIVKLDKSLIGEMLSSTENENFINSIIYACHKFGKKICAEGVETDDEFQAIKDAGADMIQGFYFYRPLELPVFYNVLSENFENDIE